MSMECSVAFYCFIGLHPNQIIILLLHRALCKRSMTISYVMYP